MTKALFNWLKSDALRDLAGVAGAVLLSLGAAEIYAPAGLIVGGLLLLTGSYLSARNRN